MSRVYICKNTVMPKLLPIVAILLLSSCASYQYFTVDSSQLPKNDQQYFVMDNDTMQLSYSFAGSGGPLTITVLNKTDQPLVVDWNRSALICNDQSYGLAQTNSTFAASTTGTRYTMTSVSGTVTVNPGMEMIPPKTKITRATVDLDQTLTPGKMILSDTARKHILQAPDGSLISYKQMQVEESQSPIRLKSYITFTIGQGTGTSFVESHSFYIGQMMQSAYKPSSFYLYQPTGNQFFFTYQNQMLIKSSGIPGPPVVPQH
jgi:hypothetical protein